jgi:octaprenyl-diphosphate synthase
MATSAAPSGPTDPVLGRLENICERRGAGGLESRLAELRSFIADDLVAIERDLQALDDRETPLYQSARHLLTLEGKRLRPVCVVLASKLGGGAAAAVRELGVAAELVHSATLLHDDVVDLGERRRGAPSARLVYGNAASIFAGDWLLVEGLRRVRGVGLPDVLDRLLAVLTEMLDAESLQLARRGSMAGGEAEYLRVIGGKTASLFEWAMFAGGRAGGLDASACAALERYGRSLGVAFQIVDDALDVAGDEAALGKALYADLREGKMTYPLMVAVRRDPSLAMEIEESAVADATFVPPEIARRALLSMREAGAVEASYARAQDFTRDAVAALAALPESWGKDVLVGVALALSERRK